jgi:hypothetical protein
MMSFLSKPLRAQGNASRCALLLLAILGTRSILKADSSLSPQSVEPNSPQEMNPGQVEPGLSQRAVPSPAPPPDKPDLDVESFFWLTHPLDNLALMLPKPIPFSPDDPSAFRPSVIYKPPLGLTPKIYRFGLLNFYPWAGIAQSFDSNVQLMPRNQISDFFATPRFGLEMQLGTPDSIYNENYDTLFAAHLSYEGYADLFYEHPDLSAFNQRFDFSSRIGRDRFMLRPFVSFSDITGSNLQLVDLQNRTRRIITAGGVAGEYGFTPVTGWRQSYSAFNFEHDDPTYINYDTWSTRQELTYLLPNDSLKAILWAGAQTTSPSAGSSGNEYLAGAGWQGGFSSRLFSELWIGWGTLQLNGNVPGRDNLSGLRYSGFTAFDYSHRLRITLLYDRAYVFNEQSKNDNYVTTVTQLKTEIFLGNHWFMTPYFGCSLDDFETSRRLDLDLRPEVEFSYVFPKENYQIIDMQGRLVGSRVFVKLGYNYTEPLRGNQLPVQDVRVSMGFNWNF